MNWTRATAAGMTVYVATGAASSWTIYRTSDSALAVLVEGGRTKGDSRWTIEADGEVFDYAKDLAGARTKAALKNHQQLDELVAAQRKEIEARGIRPGVLVDVKGRNVGPVTVKYVTNGGEVELERPGGGTFRRSADDLTVVEDEDVLEEALAEAETLPRDLRETRRALALETAKTEDAEAAPLTAEGLTVGDRVLVAGKPGYWTVRAIQKTGYLGHQFHVTSEGDYFEVIRGRDELTAAPRETTEPPASDAYAWVGPEVDEDAIVVPELVEYDPSDGEGILTPIRSSADHYLAPRVASLDMGPEAAGWARINAEIEGTRDNLADLGAARRRAQDAAEAHSHAKTVEARRQLAEIAPGDTLVNRQLEVFRVEYGSDQSVTGKIIVRNVELGFSRQYSPEDLVREIAAGQVKLVKAISGTGPEPLDEGKFLELLNDALSYHAREWDYRLEATVYHNVTGTPSLTVEVGGATYKVRVERSN